MYIWKQQISVYGIPKHIYLLYILLKLYLGIYTTVYIGIYLFFHSSSFNIINTDIHWCILVFSFIIITTDIHWCIFVFEVYIGVYQFFFVYSSSSSSNTYIQQLYDLLSHEIVIQCF